MYGRVSLLLASGALSLAFAVSQPLAGGAEPAPSGTNTGTSSGSNCALAPANRVVPNADGSSDYQYSLDGGIVHMLVPPVGWRPVDASDAELARYGFPPRPNSKSELADWVDAMSAYRSTVAPGLCSNPDPIWNTLSTDYNTNWGGFTAQPAPGNSFIDVHGEFDQPTRSASGCTGARQSAWVGIGGARPRADNSWGLIQAGTARPPADLPYAWWEYSGLDSHGAFLGVHEQPFPNLDIAVGDHVSAYVSYDTTYNVATFLVINETTGHTTPALSKTISQSAFYDGRDADFIIERPSDIFFNPYPLQNFDTIHWTSVNAENQLGQTYSLANLHDQTREQMTSNGYSTGNLLADTGDINGPAGGSFGTTWHDCS